MFLLTACFGIFIWQDASLYQEELRTENANQMQRCIEVSDSTDQDLCDCYLKYGHPELCDDILGQWGP